MSFFASSLRDLLRTDQFEFYETLNLFDEFDKWSLKLLLSDILELEIKSVTRKSKRISSGRGCSNSIREFTIPRANLINNSFDPINPQ